MPILMPMLMLIIVHSYEVYLPLEGVHKKSDFFPLRKKGANSG